MELSPLTAISPIDGRYRRVTGRLGDYFSESALIQYRIRVEIEYFIALCELPLPQLVGVDPGVFDALRDMYGHFTVDDAAAVKRIERTTNHDVKAVEYFIKERFVDLQLSAYREFIHFGLTSQDINNTAIPMSLRDAWLEVIHPALLETLDRLEFMAREWKTVPMLARTHGQPASPTTMGKEIYVFVDRLREQLHLLENIPFAAKFGGATGNFNANVVAYPKIDWLGFADRFVAAAFGLKRCRVTTQIEHYDHLAAFFDNLKRINTILLDLAKDIWTYISLNYFRQKIKEGEVGSSTMPHKVNPIDFENAEGNLGIANALLEHLAAKLPISRLQRDLTDSTVTRNIGVPMAHMMISLSSLNRGLEKLILGEEAIAKDLDENWAVVSEAIQTILRREGYPEPYEALKALTRTHKQIDRRAIEQFIQELDLDESVKTELLAITPANYIGRIEF
jgi:adenylosuccinate lyase